MKNAVKVKIDRAKIRKTVLDVLNEQLRTIEKKYKNSIAMTHSAVMPIRNLKSFAVLKHMIARDILEKNSIKYSTGRAVFQILKEDNTKYIKKVTFVIPKSDKNDPFNLLTENLKKKFKNVKKHDDKLIFNLSKGKEIILFDSGKKNYEMQMTELKNR